MGSSKTGFDGSGRLYVPAEKRRAFDVDTEFEVDVSDEGLMFRPVDEDAEGDV